MQNASVLLEQYCKTYTPEVLLQESYTSEGMANTLIYLGSVVRDTLKSSLTNRFFSSQEKELSLSASDKNTSDISQLKNIHKKIENAFYMDYAGKKIASIPNGIEMNYCELIELLSPLRDMSILDILSEYKKFIYGVVKLDPSLYKRSALKISPMLIDKFKDCDRVINKISSNIHDTKKEKTQASVVIANHKQWDWFVAHLEYDTAQPYQDYEEMNRSIDELCVLIDDFVETLKQDSKAPGNSALLSEISLGSLYMAKLISAYIDFNILYTMTVKCAYETMIEISKGMKK